MRILVTGGAGFVGARVCRALCDTGHEVVSVDLVGGSDSHVQHIVGDVRDPATMDALVARADAVIHLAAMVSVSACERRPDEARSANVEGTEVVASAVRGHARRLVLVSSAAVYGVRTGAAAETDDCRPAGVYGRTKLDAERTAADLLGDRPGALRIARPFNVYGRQPARDEDTPLVAAVVRALRDGSPLVVRGDGSQRRDFVHVDDLTGVLLRLATADLAPDLLNIGAGSSRSVLEVIAAAERIAGRRIEIRHVERTASDVPDSFADVSRLLAWDPDYRPVPLEEGLTWVI